MFVCIARYLRCLPVPILTKALTNPVVQAHRLILMLTSACFEGVTNGKSEGLMNIVAKKLKSFCLLSSKRKKDHQLAVVFKQRKIHFLGSVLLLLAFRLLEMYSFHTKWIFSEYFICIQNMIWETCWRSRKFITDTPRLQIVQMQQGPLPLSTSTNITFFGGWKFVFMAVLYFETKLPG